ncbi:MAG: hypothetical protein GC193_05110 [Cryomorphaceae bacterium]|nr:hypothetical protein [Cryomorphaceae bacterium]
MKNYLIFLTITAFLFACKAKKESIVSTEQTTTEMESTQGETTFNPEIVINTDGTIPDSAPFSLLKAGMKGDLLQLTVQYSGGCEPHMFTLYTNGMYMKSLPAQLSMQLHHESNGDNCRAMITETIAINISSVRYGDKGPLILRLKDFKESITYAY